MPKVKIYWENTADSDLMLLGTINLQGIYKDHNNLSFRVNAQSDEKAKKSLITLEIIPS